MPFFNFKLTQQEVNHLENYTIKSNDDSIFNNTVNIPYLFKPLNDIIPQHIVPNTITLVGNLVPVLTFILMSILYPDYSTPIPAWMDLLISDSIDGIRARSSGICSPIGDWLDHSLDNVTYFCFVAFLDHIFLCDSVLKDMFIALFLVYTSYCVQIQAVFTNSIHLGTVNASCEGIMAFIGMVFIDAFYPLREITIFGIDVFTLTSPVLVILLVIHSVVMVKGIREEIPIMNSSFLKDRNGNQSIDIEKCVKQSFQLLIESMLCIIIGTGFYYAFVDEKTTTNYIFNNLWIYFCSLIYIDSVIQTRLFGRKQPSIFDLKCLIPLLLPPVLIIFTSFTTSVVIGSIVSGIIMWTDWIATLLSILDGLKLKLFQHEPTRFAPKK
ncbi:Choline/ethanolaminephosphotransferase [Entamoeba marina]